MLMIPIMSTNSNNTIYWVLTMCLHHASSVTTVTPQGGRQGTDKEI
jgi:hypothetical protein